MKILMVCLGNICRSPLAEGVLKEKVAQLGLNWKIDSAGTSGWHHGEPPHNGSINIAKTNGIDITGQRSRKFMKEDFEKFDLIVAMDSSNYNDILSIDDRYADKVVLLLNYSHPNKNMAVPDPYFTNNFQEVYDLINDACDHLLKKHS